MPTLSATESATIDADDTWLDAMLFSGRPSGRFRRADRGALRDGQSGVRDWTEARPGQWSGGEKVALAQSMRPSQRRSLPTS